MKLTQSMTVRLMVWVVALCPLSLSVLFHQGIRSTPLAMEVPRKPSLAFSQYAVDLRKIHPTAETHATFVFQNRGSEPVHITSMEPSCGCLTPRLYGDRDKEIPPDELGRLVVRMQPANSAPGRHEYTVTVKYTDPEPREVRLVMKLEIPETTLTVTPPALIAYHPKGATPTVHDFVVTDGRHKRFEITDVSINTDLVETAIGEPRFTPEGNFQQIVQVSIAGDLPPTRTHSLLRIKTNDLDFPELRVPIYLQGQAAAPESKPDSASSSASEESPDHDHR